MATDAPPREEERGLRSVKDMAADGAENAQIEEEDDGQLAIAGTKPNLNLSAGGQKPTVSTASIKSLKLPVKGGDAADPEKAGQFEKGDTIRAVVDLVVVQVNFKDERRKGRVERTQREHVFEPLAIEVLPGVPDAG